MKIEVDLKKSFLFTVLALAVLVTGIFLINAYNEMFSNSPEQAASFGHSADEVVVKIISSGELKTVQELLGSGTVHMFSFIGLSDTPNNYGIEGQMLYSTGSGLQWGAAPAGGGGITQLNQGIGMILTPNPITTTGTISANTAYLQRRVLGTCASGSAIRVINVDGTVSCENKPTGSVVGGGMDIRCSFAGVTGGSCSPWGDATCTASHSILNTLNCPTGSTKRTTGEIDEGSSACQNRYYYLCIQN